VDLYSAPEREGDALRVSPIPALSEDSVDQMLVLAQRLRAANGGLLDEEVIEAVAEATGAPAEYVRLAVKIRADKQRTNPLETIRTQYLTLEPNKRRYVLSGLMSTLAALMGALEWKIGSSAGNYGVLTMVATIFIAVGVWNLLLSRDPKGAAINGVIIGGGCFGMFAIFSLILQTPVRIAAPAIIPIVLGSAVGGWLLYRLLERYRPQLGLKDPAKERQELLQQLVQLQDKLKQGEQRVTFLSVDIVGSTRMKERADVLSVEYTFSEYHRFVERITTRNGGRVHSTAGDGVTCAFENPASAYSAARTIQSGLVELNQFRNKIGEPIVLRCGIHSGTVNMPDGTDITSVNFSHVIDVAAHIQKVCPAGGIAISDQSSLQIPGGIAAVGAERTQVGAVGATIWMPRSTPGRVADALANTSPAVQPPAPVVQSTT
jgi:class 3 adenylate cyclase